MKPLFLSILLSSLLFSACTAITSSPKEEKHQLELSLHKVRTDVEELKHDLNTYEIEHHILEGKLIDQEQIISKLKQQLSKLKQGKLQSLLEERETIEKTLDELKSKQKQMLDDIRELNSHANGTTTALSQYKSKISQLEKMISAQQTQIQEILNLKEEIVALTNSDSSQTYTIKPGDSLEKISRKFNTSVETIKEQNQLSSDLIMTGQKIKIP